MPYHVNFNINPRPLQLEFKGMQQVPASDHDKLINRDKPDQHPIEAITGLKEALEQSASGTNDHTQLTNRDQPDQHPIEAIAGLGDALEGVNDTITDVQESIVKLDAEMDEIEPEAMTNEDIADIWNSVMI